MINDVIINYKFNQVTTILHDYKMKKTGYSNVFFKRFEDFKIDEIEMLDFLFKNCSETLEVIEDICKKYISSNVSWIVMQTMFTLNQTYKFGWLNLHKVDKLDTIKNISDINMKERHITYLVKLRKIKSNINNMFVKNYNQTHKRLNPFRVEQSLYSLYEDLKLKGYKVNYTDLMNSIKHNITNDWIPYFCKSNYGYYIIDSNNYYNGEIYLEEACNIPEYKYIAFKVPKIWYNTEETAKLYIKKLNSLKYLVKLPENFDWKIIYANSRDINK